MASEIPAAGPSNDALSVFYRSMPSPDEHYRKKWSEIQPSLLHAAIVFELSVSRAPPELRSDPEHSLLLRAIKHGKSDPKGGIIIYEHLAKLSMSTVVSPDDHSARACQLRYLRWVVTGMRDETSPFRSPTTGHSHHTTLDPGCASCGTADATMKCKGCQLPADNGTPFSTSYCNADCQRKHWPQHRTVCRQIRQLLRGVDMFNEVFRHLMTITFQSRYTVTSMAVDQGMAVARYTGPSGSISDTEEDQWVTFPAGLASSPDLATSILMHTQCGAPLSESRALLEMLIRPACQSLHKVVFAPKNMTRPVHIIHDAFDEFAALAHHEIVRATLPCGAEYAIDVTGQQMGWENTIVPWDVYTRTRIHRMESQELVTSQPPGYASLCQNLPGVHPSPPIQTKRAALVDTVAHGVNKLIHNRGTNSNITKLLQLGEPNFGTCRKGVIDAMIRGLDSLVQKIAEGASPALFQQSRAEEAWATLNVPLACSLIDILWLTHRERAKVAGSSQAAAHVQGRWHTLLQQHLGPLPGIDGPN